MRKLASMAATLALVFEPASALAATSTGRFTVSVRVEASCSIALEALRAELRATGAAVRACSAAKTLTPGVAAPTPTVTLSNDKVSNRPIMTVEF